MSLLEDANFDNIPDKDPEITKEELIQRLLNEYRMATAKGVNGYLCLRRVEEQIAMKKELGDEVTEQDKWGEISMDRIQEKYLEVAAVLEGILNHARTPKETIQQYKEQGIQDALNWHKTDNKTKGEL